MNVEVRNSNGKIADKSQNNIIANTYTVILEEEGTYTIFVTAYDENGHVTQDEQQYVIRKPGDSVQKLKSKVNPSNLTYTNSTTEQKRQMYTFSHEETEQAGALTDYRYIGNTPYNYVKFNNEIWRIIGVFPVDDGTGNIEERMKIIKNTSIGDMAFDSVAVNNWKTASSSEYLNETYYEVLSDTAKAMIGDTKFYLGGNNISSINGEDFYKFERGNTVYDSNPTYWVGKIALMYPSDYVYTYALGVNDKCYTDANNCRTAQGGSPTSGWLFNSASQWTLNHYSGNSQYTFYVYSSGFVNYTSATYTNVVRPTLYLASNVSIVDGDGSSGNPYQLSI